ncbi:MAG: FAD-binding protein [Christensenellales bacterium]
MRNYRKNTRFIFFLSAHLNKEENMSFESKEISRRGFLKGTAAAAGAAGLATMGFGFANNKALAEKPESVSTIAQVPQLNSGWLEDEPVINDISETIVCEALVIGGGTGGLECGASLAEKGIDTIVIEQNADVSTLRNDFGGIGSKYQQAEGTVVDKRAAMNYHIQQNVARFDQRLVKIWAEESGAALDWVGSVLEKYGAVFLHEGGYESVFAGDTIPKFPTGHSAHFDNSEYPNGKSIMKQYILDCGGAIRFNTKFIKFEHEGYKVTAAIAQDIETEKYIRFVGTKGIVLATGGYQNNEEMMQALQPHTRRLYGMQLGSTAFGAGIKACLWMGASMDDVHSSMLFDRMALLPSEVQKEYTKFSMVRIGSQPWLKVNLKGERFFNESGQYDYAPHAAAAQPGCLYCSIFDSDYWNHITQFETMGCSRVYPFPNGAANDGQYSLKGDEFRVALEKSIDSAVESGLIQKADTLEELAVLLGIPAETFIATVNRYNSLCDAGDDEDFYKDSYRMLALKKAPFYGFRNASFLLSTLDGIRIDTHSRPIDEDGVAFDGLYVIGDCSGSYFAHSYPNLITGYAHGRLLTFSRRVARQIAGEEVKDYTILSSTNATLPKNTDK